MARKPELLFMHVVIVSNQPIYSDALATIAAEDLAATKVIVALNLEQAPRDGKSSDLLLLDLPSFVDPERWLAESDSIPATKRNGAPGPSLLT